MQLVSKLVGKYSCNWDILLAKMYGMYLLKGAKFKQLEDKNITYPMESVFSFRVNLKLLMIYSMPNPASSVALMEVCFMVL
jgi:hypothetical protein